MADEWKTEFHLISPVTNQAEDWFDNADEAIAAATAKGDDWSVEEVTSYLDDRKTIWPEDDK